MIEDKQDKIEIAENREEKIWLNIEKESTMLIQQ